MTTSTMHPHHPPAQTVDGPWMHDRKWASGRIRCASKSNVIVGWIMTLLWNAIAWPVALSVLAWNTRAIRPADYFVLIFPAIGLVLLLTAAYLTLRYVKFGRSHLDLETLPGCIGGWLAGTVETSVPLRDAHDVHIRLRCVRRVTTGSGKRRRTHETTIWEEEQTLGTRLPFSREGGNAIPIAFRIPPHCPETFDGGREDIIWRLRIRAAMAGTNYGVDFIVPVFAARQASGFIPQAEHAAAKVRSR